LNLEIAVTFPVTRFVAAQPVELAAARVAARLAFAVAATVAGFAAESPAGQVAPLARSAMLDVLIQAPISLAELSAGVAPPTFFAPQAALIALRAFDPRPPVHPVAAPQGRACLDDPSSAFHTFLPFKNTP
jgi:hypothetical protein